MTVGRVPCAVQFTVFLRLYYKRYCIIYSCTGNPVLSTNEDRYWLMGLLLGISAMRLCNRLQAPRPACK